MPGFIASIYENSNNYFISARLNMYEEILNLIIKRDIDTQCL